MFEPTYKASWMLIFWDGRTSKIGDHLTVISFSFTSLSLFYIPCTQDHGFPQLPFIALIFFFPLQDYSLSNPLILLSRLSLFALVLLSLMSWECWILYASFPYYVLHMLVFLIVSIRFLVDFILIKTDAIHFSYCNSFLLHYRIFFLCHIFS